MKWHLEVKETARARDEAYIALLSKHCSITHDFEWRGTVRPLLKGLALTDLSSLP
jgi:hypothetical protein